MWTTQERCPHAHSLNNKYKSQTTAEDSTPTDSPEEAIFIGDGECPFETCAGRGLFPEFAEFATGNRVRRK